MFFTHIKRTEHYRALHEKEVPWTKVQELIIRSKGNRRKGDVFEIERDGYYVVFAVRDGIAFVINAKRST